jgi:hypothetical protein
VEFLSHESDAGGDSKRVRLLRQPSAGTTTSSSHGSAACAEACDTQQGGGSSSSSSSSSGSGSGVGAGGDEQPDGGGQGVPQLSQHVILCGHEESFPALVSHACECSEKFPSASW